jgi:RecA/RadA recombinase
MARTREPGRDHATMMNRAWGMHERGKTREQIAETLGVGVAYTRSLINDYRHVLKQQRKTDDAIAKMTRYLRLQGYVVIKKPEE